VKKLLFLLMLMSCGGAPVPEEKTPAPAPIPSPNPNPNPGGKTSFADAKKVMDNYCVDCHAGAAFTKSDAGLVASSAKQRVQNGSMPPPYAEPLPAGDKAKFLNFFSE
jgi:hypothetical protein